MGWHEQAVAWGHKYMKILGTKGKMPVFKLADNLGSKWLGICRYSLATPDNTVITFQKSIIDDPKTFERVAAHEMIHHHEFLNLNAVDIALIRQGVKTDGHGEDFLKGAAKINAVMGKDFVTKTSDAEYVLSKEVKRYFLYMEPRRDDMLYGWAVRLSPQAQRNLARRMAITPGKLIETNDRRWTNCAGKIGASIGLCRVRPADLPDILKLYAEAKPAAISATLAPQSFDIKQLTGGKPLTETERKILQRLGHKLPPEETQAAAPKPAAPKTYTFDPGAKQGRLF